MGGAAGRRDERNKFTFQGLENIPQRGGAILAQNHTSYLDWLPPLFAVRERGRRMYFMIKAEMADVKAVNYVIKHARLIPVDRRQGHDAFEVAVQRLREGQLIGMHPEATISRSFELREFKTGAARMALEAQVPIVPMVVWGAHRIWPKDHPKKVFRNKVPITVAAGRPLPPQRHRRTTQRRPAAGDERVAVSGARGVSAPRRASSGCRGGWVAARQPGRIPRRSGPPNCNERLQKRGTDGVTRPGQSQSGIH